MKLGPAHIRSSVFERLVHLVSSVKPTPPLLFDNFIMSSTAEWEDYMHVYFKDSMFAASSSFMSMTQGCNMCITQVTEHALATYHAIMAIMQPCNIQEFSSSRISRQNFRPCQFPLVRFSNPCRAERVDPESVA